MPLKKRLLEKDRDDRLKPGKAIEYGYKYFSGLMKAQNGDISLALASHNAGPHRVKQRKGMPPIWRNGFIPEYGAKVLPGISNEIAN